VGSRLPVIVMAVAISAAACERSRSHEREYELRGVVVAVDEARQEITIKHEDIPKFMPGMTMPFKVSRPELLQGRVPGDLVRATLVVRDSNAHLREIVRTGSAPVPDDAPYTRPADILEPGNLLPDVQFTDQDGKLRRLADWRGQVLAVTFVYTRCPIPNFCPLMDRHFRTVQQTVAADGDLRGRIHLVSVSIDPDYDRPPVLAARARELGVDPAIWSLVTGERKTLEAFASRFGLSILREGDAAEIVHNLATAVIAADGTLSTILRGNEWTPPDLVTELRKAVAGR
jgi:protein SCO1/2